MVPKMNYFSSLFLPGPPPQLFSISVPKWFKNNILTHFNLIAFHYSREKGLILLIYSGLDITIDPAGPASFKTTWGHQKSPSGGPLGQ